MGTVYFGPSEWIAHVDLFKKDQLSKLAGANLATNWLPVTKFLFAAFNSAYYHDLVTAFATLFQSERSAALMGLGSKRQFAAPCTKVC